MRGSIRYLVVVFYTLPPIVISHDASIGFDEVSGPEAGDRGGGDNMCSSTKNVRDRSPIPDINQYLFTLTYAVWDCRAVLGTRTNQTT